MAFMNISAILKMRGADQLYLGLGVLTSVISLIFCLVLILVYLFVKTIRNQGRLIVVFIAITNIGVCIGTLMSASVMLKFQKISYKSHPSCEAAAAVTILFRLSSYLWTDALAINLCLNTFWKRKNLSTMSMWPAHLICWGFPLSIMVTTVVADVLGSDVGNKENQYRPPWCWIDQETMDFTTWSLLAGMGWRMASIVLCSIVYLFLQLRALQMIKPKPNTSIEGEPEEKDQPDPNRQLRHLLILFVLLNVWSIWHFVINFYDAGPDLMVLLQVVGDNVQGFVNTVFLFVFVKDVRITLWKNCCKPCCKCSCKKLHEADISLPVEMEQLREEGEDHSRLLHTEEGEDHSRLRHTEEDEQVHFSKEDNH